MNDISKSEFNDMQRGIREHAVPGGMGWPMFEDGKAVVLGDATEDCRCVTRICFTKKGFYFNSSHRKGLRRYRYGEAVRRPWAPDADGVRTKAGDVVWCLRKDVRGIVSDVYRGRICAVFDVGGRIFGPAAGFVHKKPVRAFDGNRIVEGGRVFEDGHPEAPMSVVTIYADTEAVRCKGSDGERLLPAKRLVCEMPDSWERLWRDMGVIGDDGRMNGVEKDEFIRRATALAKKAAV